MSNPSGGGSKVTTVYLTAKEEADLVLKAQAGDERATERLLQNHDGMISKITARYSTAIPVVGSWEALKQTSILGFLIALKKFDPSKGVRLMTYASYWIQNELDEELARSRTGISYPREVEDIRRRILNTEYELYKQNEQWPTVSEITEVVKARYAGTRMQRITEELVTKLIMTRNVGSLDSTVGHDGEGDDSRTLIDMVEDTNSFDPLEYLVILEERRDTALDALPSIFKALSVLSEFEQEVVLRRFGLPPYDDNSDVGGMYDGRTRASEMDGALLPAPVIAKQMDVPVQKVTSALASSMGRMRKALEEV